MRLEILPSFITSDEAAALNSFVLASIKDGQFEDGRASYQLNGPGKHLVSRFNPKLQFPEVAFEIKKRIMQLLGLTEEATHTVFNDSGIVVNCSFAGGQLVAHKDGAEPGKALLRCNVLSSAPEKGGVLMVNGQTVAVEERSIYFCLVSEYMHSMTPVQGEKPRIIWQFGFSVDRNAWDNKEIGNDISRN